MPNFNQRSYEPELMDDFEITGQVIDQTLRELDTINKLLGGNYVTINGLEKLIKNNQQELIIADIGCGSGDMLKLIANWGKKRNIKLKLIGIDANPYIIEFAKNNCKAFPEISFIATNIFDDDFIKMKFDVIIATLFTHHFTEKALITLLNNAKEQCNLGIVINDLHRHWFAYYSIKFLTGWFSKSEMVKNDAAVSVMRSFKRKELIKILSASTFTNYTLRWMWAFRWQLVIRT
ncbi:MAG TPA: methyltransferase domain-containing protein [Fulvivirga sp.]|nr:methyltransferase domain-containing protein [Fulvivirga sp.]